MKVSALRELSDKELQEKVIALKEELLIYASKRRQGNWKIQCKLRRFVKTLPKLRQLFVNANWLMKLTDRRK